MNDKPEDQGDGSEPSSGRDRRVRSDARRNTDALLEAALAVFATSGVDAPVREIAVRAGVGVGTVYRHFPQRSDLVATKRGLATALHSGNPAFDTLPTYFQERLQPALRTLLDAAVAAGEVRAGVAPDDLLRAVAGLCMQSHDEGPAHARRMVALLVDGLRYGASPSGSTPSHRE